MKICILHSSYEGTHHMLEDIDCYLPDPSPYTTLHTFDHHMVVKATAKEDIDAAVAKSYDFYFNFMWGQWEDDVAGIEAIRYFESLSLPHIGQPSRILDQSKEDFYKAARKIGHPRVPGTRNFPLFVKPAISCASMFISEKSVCHNEEELRAAIDKLDQDLEPRRETRRKAHASAYSGINGTRTEALTSSSAGNGLVNGFHTPQDIIVQEFVDGQDYSCVVIEHCNTPIALTPTVYVYPSSVSSQEKFLTFDLKFDPKLRVEQLTEKDSKLIQALQKTALEAWETAEMAGATWCNVDMRVPNGGEPVVIEVNPMPAIFLPAGHQWEDPVIADSIPGGHRAMINIIIATYYLRQNSKEAVEKVKSGIYDTMAPRYDEMTGNLVYVYRLMARAMVEWEYRGSVLDLGAGPGGFGRLLRTIMGKRPGDSLTGVELSPEMARCCLAGGFYEHMHIGTIQRIIPTLQSFDHIVVFGVAHFLSVEELSLVLSCCFRLARKSVTYGCDEIPDIYNDHLKKMGEPHCFMVGNNHIKEIEAFGIPKGWKRVNSFRKIGWTSPKTSDDIYVTVIRFEHIL